MRVDQKSHLLFLKKPKTSTRSIPTPLMLTMAMPTVCVSAKARNRTLGLAVGVRVGKSVWVGMGVSVGRSKVAWGVMRVGVEVSVGVCVEGLGGRMINTCPTYTSVTVGLLPELPMISAPGTPYASDISHSVSPSCTMCTMELSGFGVEVIIQLE